MAKSSLFKSFIMGGFEGADHINSHGCRVDMVAATEHDKNAARDYKLLKSQGIYTVRESARWHLIDKSKGNYDFASLEPLIAAGQTEEMQTILTLCHYGWPKKLDIFSDEFVLRFADYAVAKARFVEEKTGGQEVPIYAPINEMSFFSWAAGEVGIFYPCAKGRGNKLKRQLVKATIAGVEAIRAVQPSARFVYVDPLIHIVAPAGQEDRAAEAQLANDSQYEAFDMLAGYQAPELGGKPDYLDIVGANFYHDNQWDLNEFHMPWSAQSRDPRWQPLSELLAKTYERYHRPIILGETSQVGDVRAQWMHDITDEAVKMIDGVFLCTAFASIRSSTGRIGKICIGGITAVCGILSYSVTPSWGG